MYLHLGRETLLNTKDMIGLFDLDTSTLSKNTRDFLSKAEKAGQVKNVSTELPKSFVVKAGRKAKKTGQTVYISQLGASTLKKRTKTIYTGIK